MDRFAAIEAFVRVVESGGFAAAARSLRLSPAMVSKHVATLEARLATRLLHRTTRRVSLTDAGQAFYDRATLVLRELDDAERLTTAFQARPEGLLRLTAPSAFASRLSPILSQFAEAYPGVRLDVLCDDKVVDLVENRLDLAIRIGRLPDSSLVARKIMPAPVAVCAAPSYLAARGTPSKLEDLVHHDCIAYTHQWAGEGWAFANADGTGEIVVRLANTPYRTNNAEIQRTLALSGKGLAQLPRFIVEEDIAAGRLVPVLTGMPNLDRWVHAVYPPGRQLPLTIRIFIDFLIEHLPRAAASGLPSAPSRRRQARRRPG